MKTPDNLSQLHQRVDMAIDDYVAFNSGPFDPDRHYINLRDVQREVSTLVMAYDRANVGVSERIARALHETMNTTAPMVGAMVEKPWDEISAEQRNLLKMAVIALLESDVIRPGDKLSS